MIVDIWRDPYDLGFNTTKSKHVDLKDGLTVVVGCNGAGKTTLLQNIKEFCRKNNIPSISYDNLHDGGGHAIEKLFYQSDLSSTASLVTASEGEAVKMNFSRFVTSIIKFIEDGYLESDNAFLRALRPDYDIEGITDNRRVILLDAIDSGLSVDSLVELSECLDKIVNHFTDSKFEIYLIVTVNEYELTVNHQCLDVVSGKYININGYNSYRKFILRNRKEKDKRFDKMLEYIDKTKKKELEYYKKIYQKYKKKAQKIASKYPDGITRDGMGLRDRYDLDYAYRECRDYINHEARFLTEDDVKDFE